MGFFAFIGQLLAFLCFTFTWCTFGRAAQKNGGKRERDALDTFGKAVGV